jgi:hypothetical protein
MRPMRLLNLLPASQLVHANSVSPHDTLTQGLAPKLDPIPGFHLAPDNLTTRGNLGETGQPVTRSETLLHVWPRPRDVLSNSYFYTGLEWSLQKYHTHIHAMIDWENEHGLNRAGGPIVHLEAEELQELLLNPPNEEKHITAIIKIDTYHRQAASMKIHAGEEKSTVTMIVLDSQPFQEGYLGHLVNENLSTFFNRYDNIKGIMFGLGVQLGGTTCGDHSLAIAEEVIRKDPEIWNSLHEDLNSSKNSWTVGDYSLLYKISPKVLGELIKYSESSKRFAEIVKSYKLDPDLERKSILADFRWPLFEKTLRSELKKAREQGKISSQNVLQYLYIHSDAVWKTKNTACISALSAIAMRPMQGKRSMV